MEWVTLLFRGMYLLKMSGFNTGCRSKVTAFALAVFDTTAYVAYVEIGGNSSKKAADKSSYESPETEENRQRDYSMNSRIHTANAENSMIELV